MSRTGAPALGHDGRLRLGSVSLWAWRRGQNWSLQIPSQTQAAINQWERNIYREGGGGVGEHHVPGCAASPSHQVRRQARSCHPPGTPDAVERMAATGWTEAIIAPQGAAGGCGWVGSLSAGSLGPPAGCALAQWQAVRGVWGQARRQAEVPRGC